MKENSYDAAIERRNAQTKDIFEKAAQEKIIDPRWVGSSGSFTSYEPHNHRLFFSFLGTPQPMSKGGFSFLKIVNNNKEVIFEHEGTKSKIWFHKKQVELRYHGRKYYLIDNAHPEEMDKIISDRRDKAVKIFKEFCEAYTITSNGKVIKEYVLDNGETGNSITEKQPEKLYYETSIVKKVYGEKKLEYKSVIAAKNAAHNAGLYDFSPEIVQRLDLLDNSFKAVDLFTKQINLHLIAIQELRDAVKDLRQGRGEGSKSHSPLIYKASSMPTPPKATRYNIRDSFPEGWFE